ncbi:hypothetical protein C922_05208 [Plasmodium inui San Antonio 1]|uniref:Uncharacterized protein n=1 Tax=Plasmodium inui San Antonio 1 TaxID=1237626 RepID=W7A5P1_9APIC|nr:hypothetical protein C922_05208 [Plasmodium inui San Antonio 1]EUD64409.1 hypothetical protein C922_05208 [Plasmodium inui San Antonio 1]
MGAHNFRDLHLQKHQWHSLQPKYSYTLDMFKENNQFDNLQQGRKTEEQCVQENVMFERKQFNAEAYTPFIQRRGIIYSLSDKVIRLYRKDTTKYVIHQTTNNTSGTNCHKERQEVHNHELCVITDEEVEMEMFISPFMMLLDECKEQ